MHGQDLALEHVSGDHSGLHVFVVKELLDGTNIVMGFHEMSRNAMAQGVGTNRFGDAGLLRYLTDRLLQPAFVQVVAAHDTGTGVNRQPVGGKEVLSAPCLFSIGDVRDRASGRQIAP